MKARLAVVDYTSCKPKKCSYECISVCPVNRSGRAMAIDADRQVRGQPTIFEDTCIGCGLCVKACPFEALYIVNMPKELEEEAVHRYGVNRFKLYRLPIPKEGQVVGVIGKNGAGKTTALRILAGEIKPNLGMLDGEPEWDDIIRRFRGSELQGYFKLVSEGKVRVVHKVQHVDVVPRRIRGTVGKLLLKVDERGVARELAEYLELTKVWDRDVGKLSGGELQKFLVAAVLSRDANVYVFDEPNSGVDIDTLRVLAELIDYIVFTQGTSVIPVTHLGPILEKLPRITRAHIMVEGAIVYSGDPSHVIPVILKHGYMRGLEVFGGEGG